MKQTRKRRKRQLKVLSVLLVLALAGTALTIYRDYNARPGFLEKVWISERGADFITVAWEKVRNVNKYVVMYDGKTVEASGQKSKVKITGLNEDTYYEFSVRADSKERKGFETLTAKAKTKKTQHIVGETEQMKFLNTPVDLKQTAETPVSYLPGNGYTVTDDGLVVFTKPGKITVTATTDENEEYVSASKEITVEVLDTVDVDAAGAKPHIFYKLNSDNCELVMTISGAGEAIYPQSFAVSDGKYITSFVNKGNTEQRIIVFGDKRTAYEPETDLGHANGLTVADGYCYSVRGGSSAECVTFDPSNKDYGSFDLAHDASGIAYDEKNDMFYTSSRKGLTAYDGHFNVVNNVGRVSRKSTYYVQDCGAYGGILLHGVSGSDPQGINYIDFYDMKNSRYLGSAECDLNEIESVLVDDEGYIELLCYNKTSKNSIWKTPINMKMLCD